MYKFFDYVSIQFQEKLDNGEINTTNLLRLNNKNKEITNFVSKIKENSSNNNNSQIKQIFENEKIKSGKLMIRCLIWEKLQKKKI